MSKSVEDVLAGIHEALATELLRRITSKEATAGDLSCARQFLKDNNIDNVPEAGTAFGDLVGKVPFTDEDYEGTQQ